MIYRHPSSYRKFTGNEKKKRKFINFNNEKQLKKTAVNPWSAVSCTVIVRFNKRIKIHWSYFEAFVVVKKPKNKYFVPFRKIFHWKTADKIVEKPPEAPDCLQDHLQLIRGKVKRKRVFESLAVVDIAEKVEFFALILQNFPLKLHREKPEKLTK